MSSTSKTASDNRASLNPSSSSQPFNYNFWKKNLVIHKVGPGGPKTLPSCWKTVGFFLLILW
jgi:hypothetical protein